MSDVFISYSRRDESFMQQLSTALANARLDVWFDREDIARGEAFWDSIQRGIDGTDTLLVVVSRSWLSSEYCNKELEYARKLKKRVFPLILEPIEGDTRLLALGSWVYADWEQAARDNWVYLRSLNWLFFDKPEKFESEFAALLLNIQEDQDHVKPHTRYGTRAADWIRNHRSVGYLLAGEDLEAAEQWLKAGDGKKPAITDEHREYIQASRMQEIEHKRKAEEDRQRIADLGAAEEKARKSADRQTRAARILTVVLFAISLLVVYSLYLLGEADIQRDHAEAEAARVAEEREIMKGLSDAVVSYVKQEYGRALFYITDVVTRYPTNAFAYQARAIFYQTLQDPSQALADITRSIELNPNSAAAYYTRATLYDIDMQRNGQNYNQAALNDYNRAIELDPENPQYYYLRGTVYEELTQYDQAIADYARTLEINTEYVPAIYGTAYVYYLTDDPRTMETINHAIAIDPNYADAHWLLGNLYLQQNNPDAALPAFARTVELDPRQVYAFDAMGRIYIDRKQYDQALIALNSSIALADDAEIYALRAFVNTELGNLDAALADYQSAVQFDEQNARYYIELGKFYLDWLGDRESATANFDIALQYLNTEDEALIYDMGNVLAELEDYSSALVVYSILIGNYPDKPEYYVSRARVHSSLQDNGSALADLNRAENVDADYALTYYYRGVIQDSEGLPEAAEQSYTRYIDLEPNDPDGYIGRAFVRYHLDNSDGALADFESARRFNYTFDESEQALYDALSG